MAKLPQDDTPLQELKHEAVPGYLKAFVIAFAVMGIYLAVILITSPGPAKGKGHGHKKSDAHAETSNPGDH